MNKISFRIRKRYFDSIMKGEKTVEYKRDTPFWRTRVANLFDDPFLTLAINKDLEIASRKINAHGVFICGQWIHKRKITSISRQKTPDDFSDQGKKDVNTKLCFAFQLGDPVYE